MELMYSGSSSHQQQTETWTKQICTKINSTFAATCHGAFFDLLEFIPSLVIVVKVGTVMLSIMRIKVVYFAPVPGSRPVRVPIIFPLDIKNCSHDHFRTLSDEKGSRRQ